MAAGKGGAEAAAAAAARQAAKQAAAVLRLQAEVKELRQQLETTIERKRIEIQQAHLCISRNKLSALHCLRIAHDHPTLNSV